MAELWQLTKLIRSKNAGPFVLTFDIIFNSRESFERARKSRALTAETFSRLYGVPLEEVRFFALDEIWAIKVSIPRPVFSGDLNDTDVFGGQFHSPLVRLVIDEGGLSKGASNDRSDRARPWR